MSEVIRMKDNKVELVTSDRDFAELICTYMGDDSKEYYEFRLNELQDAMDAAEYEIDTFIEDIQHITDPKEMKEYLDSSKANLLEDLKEWMKKR